MIIVNFIRDKEVGIFARAKRIGKGQQLPLEIVCNREPAQKDGEGSESGRDSSEEESDKSE
jgi:sphingolipid 4-desaturase/C4-monooxygenase